MVERNFHRDLSSLQRIFDLVSEFAAANAVSAADSNAIDLILEELFTNILKYRTDGAGTVAVRLVRTGHVITVTLKEYDVEAFDPTRSPEPDFSRPISERPTGGLGLHLIKQVSDSIRYEYKDRVATTTVTKNVER